MEFSKTYILPKPLDGRLLTVVSGAVAQAAVDSGVATLPYPDFYPLTGLERF
jgi:malate dehydrogenase (oxaloacetate-decarboxylating)(NADP+)